MNITELEKQIPANYVVLYFLIIFLAVWLVYNIFKDDVETLLNKKQNKTKGTGCVVTTEVQQQQQPTKVLPSHKWIKSLEASSHILIIGNTGSGKTILAKYLLSSIRDQLVIIDIKDRPNKYNSTDSSVRSYSLDSDLSFSTIDTVCSKLIGELKTRQRAMNTGTNDFSPLTVFIDEYLTIIQNVPVAKEMMLKVAVIGRELKVRLVLATQSNRVKALGLEGIGDVKDSFTMCYLGKHILPYTKEGKVQERTLVIDDGTSILFGDTNNIMKHTSDIESSRLFVFEESSNDSTDGNGNGNTDNKALKNIPLENDVTITNTTNITPEETILVMNGLLEGKSANEISANLKGTRNVRLEKIRVIKELMNETDKDDTLHNTRASNNSCSLND